MHDKLVKYGSGTTKKFSCEHSISEKDKRVFFSMKFNFQLKLEEQLLNAILRFLFKSNYDLFIETFCKNLLVLYSKY